MALFALFSIATAAQAEVSAVDVLGRTVTLPEPAKKVVLSFYYEDYNAIAGPGAMDKVVGISLSPWKDWRPKQFEAYLKAMPEIADIPDVGDTETGTFSIEKVISLEPDLVILAAWSWNALGEKVKQFENAGIPVVVVDYNAQTLERHVASTLALGKLMGSEDRAEKLAALYKERYEDTMARVAEAGPSEKKVYVELAQNGPDAIGNSYGDGMWGTVIENLGGINIAKGQIENWGPLNPEYVIGQQPDIILLAGSEWVNKPAAVIVGFGADEDLARERMRAYLTRSGWADLPAVQNGDVHAIYHGGARTLSDFIYSRYIAKLLYPEAFADIDPAAEIKAFYHEWLPIEADGIYVMPLDPANK
ncbi:ABC transporter substrate-binding protein [Rhodobacterales bacterium]|nr:ABC transporter substrate-binding protein [Rhodobacterales bacterium]